LIGHDVVGADEFVVKSEVAEHPAAPAQQRGVDSVAFQRFQVLIQWPWGAETRSSDALRLLRRR
jgi:hypothetical protein